MVATVIGVLTIVDFKVNFETIQMISVLSVIQV